MASNLPPAYDSLRTSTANIDVSEEFVRNGDDEAKLNDNNSFEDKNTRIGFIQKVLATRLLQLLLMALVLGICSANDYAIRYSSGQVHLIVLSTLAFLVTTGLLTFCTKARRENPQRYLFLILHPLSLALFISFVSTSLWLAGSLCLSFVTYIGAVFVVLLYSVFALQTKLEFAAKHAVLLAAVVQLLIYVFTVPFIYGVDCFFIFYVSLVFCLDYIYIFWDLEIMTSKKYWHDVTPDNFVDGALNLHLDYYYMIINVIMPQVRRSTDRVTNNT